MLIALLVATVGQLVTATSTLAVVSSRRHRTLDHELAVDSAVLLMADRLAETEGTPSPLIRELDRQGFAERSFDIGGVQVACTIHDDAARFNPNLLGEDSEALPLQRKLRLLQSRIGLPQAKVVLQPVLEPHGSTATRRYLWFDQVLEEVEPGMVFPVGEDADRSPRILWSNAVTFWGDGRIDLRRVNPQILEVALDDLRPGLARKMLAQRPTDRAVNFTREALRAVDAEVRERVARRITFDARRYAIVLETAIRGDRRRWFVVATVDGTRLDIHHESTITW
jgi:hypothetical protein